MGLTILDAALVAECLGTHVAPSPFIGSAVIAPLALQHADSQLAASHLAQLVDGSITTGVASSELAGARGGAGVETAVNNT